MVTEFIGKAWKAYTKNFWQVVGATVLLLVLVAGVVLVGVVPLLFSGLLTISEVLTAAQFQLSTGLVASIFIFFAAIIAAMILSVALGGGLVAVYADALRGKAKFQTMFSVARKKFFTILGANALAGILILVIYMIAFAISAAFASISSVLFLAFFILSFIAAALISILFSFVNQAVIIDNRKAVDSVKTSVKVVKSNYLQFLALVIILAVISVMVSYTPYMPILFFPLFYIIFWIYSMKDAYKTAETIKGKNSGIAVVLSFFIPGLGQIYNGQIERGILFIFVPIFILMILILSIFVNILSGVGILSVIINFLVITPVSGIAYTAFYLAKRKSR